MVFRTSRLFTAILLTFGVWSAASSHAQDLSGDLFDGVEFGTDKEKATSLAPPGKSTQPMQKPSFGGTFSGGIFDVPGFGDGVLGNKPGVKVSVSPESARVGETVTVSVRVDMEPGAHTYPIDSESTSTLLLLAVPPSMEAVDDKFVADRAPEVKETPGVGLVSHFKDHVTWSKRFRVVATEPSPARIEGSIDYQVCKDLCVPKKDTFAVDLAIESGQFDATGGYVVEPTRAGKLDPVQLQFEMVPAKPRAGEEVTLAITLTPETGWHALALTAANGQEGPTSKIELTSTEGLEPLDEAFVPDKKPEAVANDGAVQNQHPAAVTWQRRFRVESDSDVSIAGTVVYHVCKENEICLPANRVDFALGESQPEELIAAAGPIVSSQLDRSVFAAPSASPEGTDDWSIGQWLATAFLGGLILNVMPCVLPVLAIKVMSFVQQAGESRGRILALNLVYSAGVLAVFAILGTLSATIGLSFGGQFQNVPFTIAMCVVVLIAALSLVGVFEIPVPGFLGNSGATHQEGLTGAFLTGVMATVLATPCTGPFIGAVVAWGAKQSIWLNYGVWLSMGLGMSSPYLVAGFYPRIIDYLPRPGMWMVYFKQVSGFVLIGTVVFLMTGVPSDYRLHLLMALVGISFGCWVIGTFRPHEKFSKRVPVFVTALLFAGGISLGAYKLAQPSDYELPWQPFSSATLQTLVDSGEPVLVDFTADWCLICKQNEFTALNVESTYRLVKSEGITTLYADFTHEDPEIKSWLERFGQSGVPLTVVYPRGGGEPVKLTGPYSNNLLVETLKQATANEELAMNRQGSQVQ